MKNALEAYKIRLQGHLRRFKKIIGIYDKIFVLKYICILNYGNVVMRTDPIFLSFGLFLPSSLNRYDGADIITLPQR